MSRNSGVENEMQKEFYGQLNKDSPETNNNCNDKIDQLVIEKGNKKSNRDKPLYLNEINNNLKNRKYWITILAELIIFILYLSFVSFDELFIEKDDKHKIIISEKYPMFQDVHVMIFIGFGFLMTFLKLYSWSAVGINFLLAAWTIQLAILSNSFFKINKTSSFETLKVNLDFDGLINADFAAGSILIAFGAVIGKLNFFQYFIMCTLQVIFYSLNMSIGLDVLGGKDVGGSMIIHAFGGFFGVAVAYQLRNKTAEFKNLKNCGSNYNSNIFAFIGTIFLWIYWPSFNAVTAETNTNKLLCIFNTILSISASCVSVFFFMLILKRGKLYAEYVLNATLAGGVIIGSTADLIQEPWVAVLIGICGGMISLLGYHVLNPRIWNYLKIHDSCGVLYLHALPGFFGGLFSFFYILINPRISQHSYNNLFTLLMTVGFAILSGLVSGFIINLFECDKNETNENVHTNPFEDAVIWEMDDISDPKGQQLL